MSTKIVVSLFAGAGGFDLGFEKAGFNVRVAVERDKTCCATLRQNNPKKAVICADIETVTADAIFKAGKMKQGSVFAVIGGPPCQGFSQAGPRNPKDPRNFLYSEYFRIVEGLKPRVFLMENTSGILCSRNMPVFRELLFTGQKLGYAVGYRLLNAVQFGVPQERRRCFVFGRRLPDFERLVRKPQTVGDAISDLEDKEVSFNG